MITEPTLHVVGLPYTETTYEFEWCAYTAKVRKFCDMMASLGRRVVLYAGEENEGQCDEHIACAGVRCPVTGVAGSIPSFDPAAPLFTDFARRVTEAMRSRVEPHDVICLIAGRTQQSIAQAFPENRAVEFGVGYGGVFAPHLVFESYAWMHTVYGAFCGGDAHTIDGRFFDAVIPNYFEVDRLPLQTVKDDYLLYFARMDDRKGIGIAVEVANRTGLPLKTAGAGPAVKGAEHFGVVGPAERAELMGGARAILCPTLYIEPFGGAAVEAMLCGTPVISTDWGAFTETNVVGTTGYRCRTLSEFIDAVDRVGDLDPLMIRAHAIAHYSTDQVRHQYQAYFERLETLWGDGWYAAAPACQSV